MKKSIALSVLIAFTICVKAQNINSKKAVQASIENFFKGFHKGDVALLKTTIHKDLKAQTTTTNSQGIKLLTTTPNAFDALVNFAKGVKPTDDYFEKILSYTIKIDGNLASVWTPYEFYNKGKFSHCGVNSFQLFNNNGTWQIIYLIDTRRTEGCQPTEK